MGQTTGTGAHTPIGKLQEGLGWGRCGVAGINSFPGPVGTTIGPQCPLGIPGCVQGPFVSPVLLGVTLRYSVVPQGRPCKEQGWEEAGAERDPRGPKSCWIQVGSGQFSPGNSQEEANHPWMGPALAGGSLRGEAAQGGWNPAWRGREGLTEPLQWQPLTDRAPLPPAEARALPQPEPPPRRPPWTPESSRGVSMSHSPSGYSCTERLVSPSPGHSPGLARGGLGAALAVASPGAAVGSGTCCWCPGGS